MTITKQVLQYDAMMLVAQTGLPALLMGPPGIGKSAVVREFARQLDSHIEILNIAMMDPSEIQTGLPMIVKGESEQWVEYAPPGFARRILQNEKAGKASVLFLDEISCASPTQQAPAMRLIHDREVGDQKLPDSCLIIAAANPSDVAAGGWDLAAPLANRFVHLSVHFDVGIWADGMADGFKSMSVPTLPKEWRNGIPAKMALVGEFGRTRPGTILRLPDGDQGVAWPSGRTWHYVAILLAAVEAAQRKDLKLVLLQGCVGEGPTIEFLEWEDKLDLPDVNKDYLPPYGNPSAYRTPLRGDKAAAIWSAIGFAVLSDPTPERWSAAMDMAEIAANENAVDIAAPTVQKLLKVRPPGARLSGMSVLKAFSSVLKAADQASNESP
tara:strand:+ start:2959 stop:4107 length:1149 start_codon:yes stop_codon:yes gene_type:complete